LNTRGPFHYLQGLTNFVTYYRFEILKVKDFLGIYRADGLIQTIAEKVRDKSARNFHLKGLSGSLDAIIAASVSDLNSLTSIFILHDKEEAAYFQNDLQNLLPDKEILLFPASYKKAYKFEEIENANILRRAEVLSAVNNNAGNPSLIVTYPEALAEKVINKKSLTENTFVAKTGEKLDVAFLTELLQTYDFEKSEFVYEAGQYSVRGGIMDIFSYANDLPFRIELFGDEIESIRTFDPTTQLSVETRHELSIVPNVQTRLLKEIRESFLNFLSEDTIVWIKDVSQTVDIIEHSFEKATEEFEQIMKETAGSSIITKVENLFDSGTDFKSQLKDHTIIEFGKLLHFKSAEVIPFISKPQPSFNKEFKMLADNLSELKSRNFTCCIASESHQQIDRLTSIFEELNHDLKFEALYFPMREGFIDENVKVACYTDHQIFDRFHRYKSKAKYSKSKSMTLKELRTLHPGDYISHMDYGIARFAGLEKVEVGGRQQEAIRLIFRDDDLLYISIHALHKISRYSGKEGGPPQMTKLGSGDWDTKKQKVKKKVKDIAKELISLYAKRKAAPGFAYSKDSFLQVELESSFIYEDTPDQAKATADVKEDMQQPHPMDRLVCGDVGFGKTEVAIRAAFKAVCDGKQVAILVPTTILAMQHYKTFKERLANFPCMVEYINRFKTNQQIKETLKRVEEGKTNILIGTHRIISKDIKFKDLGLLVIDEEQKFGVKVKEKLKEFKINVDTLTLTATPIPRTLHFSLMGARDLSIIATPPPNRQPVTTEIHVYDDTIIRDAIMVELKRNGQVFMVHNRVKDIEEIADKILRLVPDAKVGIAHGQMEGAQLEKAMMKFVEAEYDVLVSTNIIESGLDIPNANTIIINSAHMFGLSDLHQMRGRVGRSNKKAYCYLLTPPVVNLPSDSRKRLSALEEFSELGDGFKVAMRDLDIRGAGNLLGAEQSGFISDLGFDMYHKILDEAIQELKETEFKELFKKELEMKDLRKLTADCVIETDLAVVIPDKYVSNISERLSLYSSLDNIKNEEELEKFRTSVTDRFGPSPKEVTDLMETVRLRWFAEALGFEKLSIKNETMKGYFVPAENEAYYKSEVFGHILKFVQAHSKKCRLREINKKLILVFEDIETVAKALEILGEMNFKKTVPHEM
jgi:transcription-repair coupling factor (superfamily II helicase)